MALTGLDTDPAVRLAAALVRVEVLAAADPPRFLHPVVRAAVDASLGSDERDRMHRAAARELDRDGAAPGRVAAHLMHVQPAGDAWVAGRLRQAARSSLAAGAPAEAGDQLRRTFAEPPPPGERTGVLRELAAADASAGRQSAAGWLAEALARTSDPRESSVDVLRESPALLERAKSIAELGAALRRSGQRAAARPLLAEALDLAAGCGARPLASRLHTELAAAGGRPRRERRHGLDALTPSELRVARLAADGQTNRQIAHGLYVTLKTVETHLAHVYAKLGIARRDELPAALAGENLGVPTPTRTAGR
jgi:DNA-binding NarL/FixJ family response regulator